MDRDCWRMNVARHFSAWQDLESLPAMNGALHTAGDGHISGPNDSFDVCLLRDENRVSRSQRTFHPPMDVQGTSRFEIAPPRR